MKVLLTGATGYVGKRLLPVLLRAGHEVVCCVRDKDRFETSDEWDTAISVIECNFLVPSTLDVIPDDIDAAYYLIHSMSGSIGEFASMEKTAALNFRNSMQQTQVQQVIYLSGIVNNKELSAHLSSRKAVEDVLAGGPYHLTTLRAGIIVGSGSSSFEIIRDLVEKLPLMVAPRWLHTRTQPIAIRNVIQFLLGVLKAPACYDLSFDIGGPEVMTYKDMLLRYAKVRGLRRWIYIVPVMTPKLSSYWLYFITSTSYKLAVNLVDSMKVEVICEDNQLHEHLGIDLLDYDSALEAALNTIASHRVLSSWKDAQSSSVLDEGVSALEKVPSHGCFVDRREIEVSNRQRTLDRIWAIGGSTGWYYATWLWKVRGFMDKLNGGVGLRRGRTSMSELKAGDSLDFWRVLHANKEAGTLLLYAEMKLPGEAWLQFSISGNKLVQEATFRPLGLKGRTYWYSVFPFHAIIFKGLIRKLAA